MRLDLDSCELIYTLDGAEQLRRHTLHQLERYADTDWVISDLVRMECLMGHGAQPINSDCSPTPLETTASTAASSSIAAWCTCIRRCWNGRRAGSAGIFSRLNCFLAVDCMF